MFNPLLVLNFRKGNRNIECPLQMIAIKVQFTYPFTLQQSISSGSRFVSTLVVLLSFIILQAMEDLDSLLEDLGRGKSASTVKKQRPPSSRVDLNELEDLMEELAVPTATKTPEVTPAIKPAQVSVVQTTTATPTSKPNTTTNGRYSISIIIYVKLRVLHYRLQFMFLSFAENFDTLYIDLKTLVVRRMTLHQFV